jgi:plastocyanin
MAANEYDIKIDPLVGAPPGKPQAGFNPNPAQAKVGNLIVFRNNDEANAHWPTPDGVPDKDPKGKRVGWWMDAAIPNKLPGEDAPTSKQGITPSVATDPQGIKYFCALHPNEIGTLIVS